jgi:hypothetical protein
MPRLGTLRPLFFVLGVWACYAGIILAAASMRDDVDELGACCAATTAVRPLVLELGARPAGRRSSSLPARAGEPGRRAAQPR